MNVWDTITGNDINRDYKELEQRAQRLPAAYRAAWEEVKANLWPHSNLTGRNLMPILGGVLELLEEGVADGISVTEVLGDDIKGFCLALASEEGAKSYRDRWRDQLNRTVARKLGW